MTSRGPKATIIALVVVGLLIGSAGIVWLSWPQRAEEEAVTVASNMPLPIVSIRHDGELHHGRQESFCWQWVPKLVCQDVHGWEGFRHAPAIRVIQGDLLTLVVDQDEGRLGATIFAVQDTSGLIIARDLGSFPDRFVVDLQPDVYYLTAFYQAEPGDVSYGFKLDVQPAWNPLADTSWHLEPGSSDVTISFAAVKIKGWTGCNTIEGEYRVEDDGLSFIDLGWTEKGCPTQEAFQQEQAFQDALVEVKRWKISGASFSWVRMGTCC